MSTWIRVGVAVVAAGAALGSADPGADPVAHLSLRASSPEQDEMVRTSPEAVTLWFTQAPQMAGTSVRLLPKGGQPLELAAATARRDDPKIIELKVSETLPDGGYEVMWRAMAQDGHTIRGDFGFSVQTAGAPQRAGVPAQAVRAGR